MAGRPPSLTPDPETLKIVKGLGNIQATSKECSAVLGVSEPTWITFKKIPVVADAFRDGQGEGLASLRRRQFKLANDGNATMLIWLGKQYLGQADKQEISVNQMDQLTDEQLIERIRAIDDAIRPLLEVEGTGGIGLGVGPKTTH